MKIGSILARLILYAMVPFLFVISLGIIAVCKLLGYAYRLFSYSVRAVGAFLAFVLEKRTRVQPDISEEIQFSGFDYDPEQDIFYSRLDAWQREYGYCRLYDEAAAPFGMIVDCEPVYFEYDGKSWLIEFWKGQYDLTTGCEIGVFATDGPTSCVPRVYNRTFYKSISDSELLRMSYTLKKNGKALFLRSGRHWWLTGFKLGEFSRPSELKMSISITFNDDVMYSAFIRGMKAAGYSGGEIIRSGTTASFIFGKPKTRQPFTRTRTTDWLVQSKNRYMCEKFNDLTGDCDTVPEKLEFIKEKAPWLYKKLMNLGKSELMFQKCIKISNYI